MLSSAWLRLALAFASIFTLSAKDILLTNDDGWVVAQISAQYRELTKAGFNVVLSCPSEDKSGTGSRTTTPTVLKKPCEYDTCPVGSPPEGPAPSNSRVNYVNAYPVDAANYGIKILSPKFFSKEPDFVDSGPNIGTDILQVHLTHPSPSTAVRPAKLGVPSTASSGDTGAQPSDYKWVFSRNLANIGQEDIRMCESTVLPTEKDIIAAGGCFISVSVLKATTKANANAELQAAVYRQLNKLPFTCLASS
ncbi:hypothetical protein IEO21_10152 [Rhodonia placenta]|uniref:Survival protein SurE-like phosphatase/nucleotidase domain-containing protein n=1 Tax=Rhodonia placenta TaxID=104341 RepID=A0A8H7NSZ6_9APHY|nr:hypothetical protein IEO21_10152 [Postia placenta]